MFIISDCRSGNETDRRRWSLVLFAGHKSGEDNPTPQQSIALRQANTIDITAGEDGWDNIVTAQPTLSTLPSDFSRHKGPLRPRIAVMRYTIRSATLSFSDWEYILS